MSPADKINDTRFIARYCRSNPYDLAWREQNFPQFYGINVSPSVNHSGCNAFICPDINGTHISHHLYDEFGFNKLSKSSKVYLTFTAFTTSAKLQYTLELPLISFRIKEHLHDRGLILSFGFINDNFIIDDLKTRPDGSFYLPKKEYITLYPKLFNSVYQANI